MDYLYLAVVFAIVRPVVPPTIQAHQLTAKVHYVAVMATTIAMLLPLLAFSVK